MNYVLPLHLRIFLLFGLHWDVHVRSPGMAGWRESPNGPLSCHPHSLSHPAIVTALSQTFPAHLNFTFCDISVPIRKFSTIRILLEFNCFLKTTAVCKLWGYRNVESTQEAARCLHRNMPVYAHPQHLCTVLWDFETLQTPYRPFIKPRRHIFQLSGQLLLLGTNHAMHVGVTALLNFGLPEN